MWTLRGPDGTITPGWTWLPLRAFLGGTFLYAGLQKLANPQFFHNASPTSIHAQLAGAARTSPIHALLGHLLSIAPLVGALIAFGEVAAGVGTLLGLWTRVAAGGGMLLSLMLFLTVSYHSSPYFTGADIVFLFAWTPLLLGGAGGGPALDTWFDERVPAAADPEIGLTRREVLSTGLIGAVVAAGAVALSGLVVLLGRAAGGTTAASGASSTLSNGSGGSTGPSTTSPATSTTGAPAGGAGSTTTSTTGATPSGTGVGPASSVPVGGSASFTDPKSGDPALVIQHPAGRFTAFDAVCPHAGCTVAYVSSAKIIACPCHGSEFDPVTGDVLRGPAPNGLTRIKMAEGPNGELYVQ